MFGTNDLESVVRRRYPAVDLVVQHLQRFGPARMTGSGSAVFVPTPDAATAQKAIAGLPDEWRGWAVRSLAEHPLAVW